MRFTGLVISLMCALAPGCRDSIPVTACGGGCPFTCAELSSGEWACLRFPDGGVGDVAPDGWALDAQPSPDLPIDVDRPPVGAEMGMSDAAPDTAPSDGWIPDSEPVPDMGAPDGPAPLPTLMLQPVGRGCAERDAMEVEVTSLGAYLEGAAPEGSEDVEIYLPTAPPDCSCPYALPAAQKVADERPLIPRWRIVGCLGSVCAENCAPELMCVGGWCTAACPQYRDGGSGEDRCIANDDRDPSDSRLDSACACSAVGAACVRSTNDAMAQYECRLPCTDVSDCPPRMACLGPERKTWLVRGQSSDHQRSVGSLKFCVPGERPHRAACLTPLGIEGFDGEPDADFEDWAEFFEGWDEYMECIVGCFRPERSCDCLLELAGTAHACSRTHHPERCLFMPECADE